jgi:hypothetical protein
LIRKLIPSTVGSHQIENKSEKQKNKNQFLIIASFFCFEFPALKIKLKAFVAFSSLDSLTKIKIKYHFYFQI